jgi:hypothetical protein
MRKPETVTMTMRELDRLKVIQAVVEHSLPIWRAAEKLGLSRRQIEREWRKVSQSLTLQYAKVLYLLEDLPEHRGLIHRYIEVAEHPDGHVELWADGASLPYTTYDRFAEVDQGAIVDNKRLGRTLAIAAEVQALRDNRHWSAPSRTLSGDLPRRAKAPLSVKRQRLVNRLDLERAMQHHPLSATPSEEPAEGPPGV